MEFGVPLNVLAAPNMELALNRKGHGLTAEQLAHSIAEMVEAGELGISVLEAPGQRWRKFRAFPEQCILELIERQSDHPDFIRSGYHLTQLGGSEWEKWAEPNWRRYNRGWTRYPEKSKVYTQAIIAATAPLAYELLELANLLHFDQEIIPGSVRMSVRCPWRATYWKTLPEGFEFRFRGRHSDEGHRRSWDRWCELNRWYHPPDY